MWIARALALDTLPKPWWLALRDVCTPLDCYVLLARRFEGKLWTTVEVRKIWFSYWARFSPCRLEHLGLPSQRRHSVSWTHRYPLYWGFLQGQARWLANEEQFGRRISIHIWLPWRMIERCSSSFSFHCTRKYSVDHLCSSRTVTYRVSWSACDKLLKHSSWYWPRWKWQLSHLSQT